MKNKFLELILDKYPLSLHRRTISIDLVYGLKKHGMGYWKDLMHHESKEKNPDIEIYRNCGYQYRIEDRNFVMDEIEWTKVKSDIIQMIRDRKLETLI